MDRTSPMFGVSQSSRCGLSAGMQVGGQRSNATGVLQAKPLAFSLAAVPTRLKVPAPKILFHGSDIPDVWCFAVFPMWPVCRYANRGSAIQCDWHFAGQTSGIFAARHSDPAQGTRPENFVPWIGQ